jgi:hypothetical protein
MSHVSARIFKYIEAIPPIAGFGRSKPFGEQKVAVKIRVLRLSALISSFQLNQERLQLLFVLGSKSCHLNPYAMGVGIADGAFGFER